MTGLRLAAAAGVAGALVAVAAPAASGALPRPGYWQAQIGSGGPKVGMLVAGNRRQLLTVVGRLDVQCPDGHTHTIDIGAPNVMIDPLGSFLAAHTGPPDEFDHPGIDGWQFGGRFTSATRAAGQVAIVWTGEGVPCRAPSGRRTWTGHWRAEPKLTVTPSVVRRGSTLTLRGRGYLPRQVVHVELPNRVRTLGAVTVLPQDFTVRADRRGRFQSRVRVPSAMKTNRLWRAQAWQLECDVVCWVHAEDFYRVTP